MGISRQGDDDRDMVEVLRERVLDGDYTVDPRAVAEAMLARLREPRPPWASWSKMLVAVEPSLGSSGEREPLAGDDAA